MDKVDPHSPSQPAAGPAGLGPLSDKQIEHMADQHFEADGGAGWSMRLVEDAQAALDDFDALLSDSEGVYGLHRNGDPAPWSELIAGGRFDEWTAGIERLRVALATHHESHTAIVEARWRPEVQAFADLMEAQLRANDHKPGWIGEQPWPLLDRLREETGELAFELQDNVPPMRRAPDRLDATRVGKEAADVANFAMMIADVCGALAAWNRRPPPASETALVEVLERIEQLQPTKFVFPEDWDAQIAGCDECSRYTGHPIQQGICDTHRRPIWDRQKHESFEAKALGYRAKEIARSALAAHRAQQEKGA